MLRPLWRSGYRYFKAGVILNELEPQAWQSGMLFATHDPVKSARTMEAMDTINARFGRSTVRPMATGLARSWGTRHSRLSPRYTTHADEMMEAVAW